MPPTPPNQRMGELHEIRLARAFGGRKTRSSGNQWHDQGDGRNNHEDPLGFCWDGKSTKNKSLTITLDMIAKLREEAQGEHLGFGLCWYGNESLTEILEDLVAVELADWEEILPAARAWAALEAELGGGFDAARVLEMLVKAGEREGLLDTLRAELDEIRPEASRNRLLLAEAFESLRLVTEDRDRYKALAGADLALQAKQDETIAELRDECATLRTRLESANSARDQWREVARGETGRIVPPGIPRLPWAIIQKIDLETRSETVGAHYAPDGRMTQVAVSEVRVERSPDARNRPRLIVNGIRLPDGDLYVNNRLVARVCDKDPSVEVG